MLYEYQLIKLSQQTYEVDNFIPPVAEEGTESRGSAAGPQWQKARSRFCSSPQLSNF